LSRSYEVLRQLTPLILANRGKQRMAGFRTPINEDGSVLDTPVKKTLGGIEFTVTFTDPWMPKDKQTIADHGGMMIWAGGEDYWFAGQGITITYKGADGGLPLVGLDVVEEGEFKDGIWIAGRRLNGDQTHQGRHVRLPPGNPQIQKVRFYRYR
jgi:beta-galactosidase GanA